MEETIQETKKSQKTKEEIYTFLINFAHEVHNVKMKFLTKLEEKKKNVM